MVRGNGPSGRAKEAFVGHFPHAFVILAHCGGVILAVWMGRWDLAAAGAAFGVPSTLLFLDLFSGRNITVKLLRKLLGP